MYNKNKEIDDMNNEAIEKSVKLSELSIEKGGGPFGAVIVKNGQIIAEAHNTVTITNDPTAHAEINAIREACNKLKTFDLSDCEIYSSCEPCPMCLSAIYWAKIPVVYYINTKKDAAAIGFSDDFIYNELSLPKEERKLKMIKVENVKAANAFEKWTKKEDKINY